MAKLTKSQLKSYRMFCNKGWSISESRRVAKLPYSKLVNELSARLKEKSARIAATYLD